MSRLPYFLLKTTFLILAILFACYLLAALFLYFQQEKLLYLPDNYTVPEANKRASSVGLKGWPDSTNPIAFVTNQPQESYQGTIIVFHGNGGTAIDRFPYVTALEQRGWRVILAEYPGYGSRLGEKNEISFTQDGIALVESVNAQFDRPLFVWGTSLGSGVASAVAAQRPHLIDGIALLTPFNTLPDIAQYHYPYFPVKPLIKDQYNNSANLKNYPGPIMLLIAEKDSLIPPQFSHTLFEQLSEPKKLMTFPHAGHNTLPLNPNEDWWDETVLFLLSEGK